MTLPPTTPTSRGSGSRGSEEDLPSRRRKPVFASQGVVATSQPLAASVGLNILRRGGTAVDAAVAAAVTLTVVQPGSNDIGGDLFAIVWDGQQLYGLNGSGRSPVGLTRPRVLASGSATLAGSASVAGNAARMPGYGWLSVTVPGAPAGWRDLHARFGRLEFAELFADAIGYAENGYPVSPTVAALWARAPQVHATLTGPEFQAWPSVFAPGGRTPRAGEWWRNPDAARSLRLIAESGAAAFYSGEIAEAMAQLSALTGGTLSAEDLSGHGSLWVDPISVALPRPRGLGTASERTGHRRALRAGHPGRARPRGDAARAAIARPDRGHEARLRRRSRVRRRSGDVAGAGGSAAVAVLCGFTSGVDGRDGGATRQWRTRTCRHGLPVRG